MLSDIYASLGGINYQSYDSTKAISLLGRARLFHPGKISKRIPLYLVGLINHYNNKLSSDSSLVWLDTLNKLCAINPSFLPEKERLESIYYLLRDDSLRCRQHALNSINLFRPQKFPDPYGKQHAYVMLATELQNEGQYDSAYRMIDTALMILYGQEYGMNELKTDINSISTLATKAEILGDEGMNTDNDQKIFESLALYDSIKVLLHYFIKFDADGLLFNQFYNNYYHTKLVRIISHLYAKTSDEKWLLKLHDIIASYKAQLYAREKLVFEMSKTKIGKVPAFKRFTSNEDLLDRVTLEVSKLPVEKKLSERKKSTLSTGKKRKSGESSISLILKFTSQ